MKALKDLALFLNNSVSIYHVTTTQNGRYIYANQLYRTIFFNAGDDITQHRFQDNLPAEDLALYNDTTEYCLANPGETMSVDLRRTRRDGSFFWIRWEFYAGADEQGSTVIQALGTDASERKRAEIEKQEFQEKLFRERYLLRTLIDNLPDCIYVKDTDSRYILTNKAMVRAVCAGSEVETIGRTAIDYYDEASATQHLRYDRELLNSGSSAHSVEEFMTNRKGEGRWFLTTRVPLKEEDENVIGLVGISRDITETRKLQEELAAQSINRQRQITEATIMGQERERAEIGKELHDNINQILTTTKMYLDMALSEKEISEELTIKSHENISSAIEEIRMLSKSLVPPSLGDIGLKAAITEMLNNLMISKKVNFRLKTSGMAKRTIPQHIQLMVFRIVQEQLNNIVKHSEATSAEIKLEVSKKALSVTITDNGIGFDSRTRVKGIGLMNITSRAEVHNGNVEIISAPGAGCTLKVSIPF